MLIDRRLPGFLARRSCGAGVALLCAVLSLAGCGGTVGVPLSTTPTGPSPTATPLTGNWQIAAATTNGAQAFSALAGAFVQEPTSASGTTTLVSVLQAEGPSQCYVGQTTVPSEGNVATSSFSLTSFSVDGQYLTIDGTPSAGDDTFTGSFSISGGCGDGVKGTVSGTRISPLTGTYAGTLTAVPTTVSLLLTQDATADGFGYFHVQGTATFAGISCFTGGTLDGSQSTILGDQVLLTIQTNESPSSTVTVTGTVPPAADTLTVTSLRVVSGGCSGTTSSGTLMR